VINSPFNHKQTELLNQVLPTLTDSQKIWLNGYLNASQNIQNQAYIEAQKEFTVQTTTAAQATESTYSRNNPFKAEVLENINLNGRGSNKKTALRVIARRIRSYI
jgi:sulfite reductase alpha subunit-like flavoprotein